MTVNEAHAILLEHGYYQDETWRYDSEHLYKRPRTKMKVRVLYTDDKVRMVAYHTDLRKEGTVWPWPTRTGFKLRVAEWALGK